MGIRCPLRLIYIVIQSILSVYWTHLRKEGDHLVLIHSPEMYDLTDASTYIVSYLCPSTFLQWGHTGLLQVEGHASIKIEEIFFTNLYVCSDFGHLK